LQLAGPILRSPAGEKARDVMQDGKPAKSLHRQTGAVGDGISAKEGRGVLARISTYFEFCRKDFLSEGQVDAVARSTRIDGDRRRP